MEAMEFIVSRRSLMLNALVGGRELVSIFVEGFLENQEKLEADFLELVGGCAFVSGVLPGFWVHGKVPEMPLTRGGPFGVS